MALDRKIIWREVRDIVILMLVGILMTWAGVTCRNCYDNSREFWIVASFTALMWVLLWKGNSYLADYISTKMSWIDQPGKRFLVGLVATITYTFLAMYILGAIYTLSFKFNLTAGITYSVIITIIISLFMHSRAFLINWKQSVVTAEQLKRESIAAKYESLKNQVNPHFLFNSFNALSNLVYEDQDKAVKFIKQLSEVYRYVLDTREKEVVPLADELKFLNSYIYLQKIRFADKLSIEISINTIKGGVAPLALQMLIENAIKHNVVSEDDPLTVKVFEDKGFIVVENNLQKKTSIGEPSAGVGLENICKRYEFLSSNNVEVSNNSKTFVVKLPLLTLS
ncbi:sensor histidine kinase [Chryseosolibacter indicus]|uniref:Histidine kinase n=1 Tax=Chryseosolibacter indicus TaxID=2782351 RepID=A0ABS5VTH0_9BACT|nr:histidine kinase [Chryseosolibacter indicus]MBT1704703.1 histidine kinase [Chryseosolibacter indicus]